MNRYRSARRAPGQPTAAAPIVAFLLIACFGLLFVTGCSSSRVSDQDTVEDDTFTAEDLARFQELGRDDTEMTTGTGSSVAAGTVQPDAAMTSMVPAESVTDPELRKRYDAMRAGSSGKGANLYRVTNAFLNVRTEPAVNAAFLMRLNQGDLVTVVEFTNASWAKVTLPGGQTGYLSVRYISKLTTEEKLKEEQKAFDGLYFVNFAFVNVRQSADTGADKIGEIPGQTILRPLSMEKDWARVPFNGKEGYVSTQYLSPFKPNFLVRQDSYTLPILHYSAGQESTLTAMAQHIARLKQDGIRVLTLRELFDTVQAQETRDSRIPPKSVVLAVSGVTSENVKRVSDTLTAAGVPATLFVQTDQIGLSGISEKQILTLQANGFDIQSGGHTGDDLRTLTNAQTQLELEQSRVILEEITKKTVFAVAYPQGGANDRVLKQAAESGYLFGVGSAPDKTFTREQFLRLPSYMITSGMTAEDVVKLAN